MRTSAFGVQDDRISKADDGRKRSSAGAAAAKGAAAAVGAGTAGLYGLGMADIHRQDMHNVRHYMKVRDVPRARAILAENRAGLRVHGKLAAGTVALGAGAGLGLHAIRNRKAKSKP